MSWVAGRISTLHHVVKKKTPPYFLGDYTLHLWKKDQKLNISTKNFHVVCAQVAYFIWCWKEKQPSTTVCLAHALVAEVMGDGHSYLMWSKVEGQESEKCRELWSVYHVEKAPKCHWKLNPYEHPSPLDRKWSSCLEKHHISFISFFTRLLIQFRCRAFAGMHGIQQLWAHNRTSKSYVFFLKAKIDKFKLPLCKLFPSLILYTLKI